MDSSLAHPQVVGQTPFYYYNPDTKVDSGPQGRFSQHPQVPVYHPQGPPLLSRPMYSRPTSSGSQPPMSVQAFNPSYKSSLTPVASPRPFQKPGILIQNQSPRLLIEPEVLESDLYYSPSTPPLSASGSTISSPSSCDTLQTPMNAVFFGVEGFEGVKEGCQGEVQSENLAGEWARCGSPPMTPVYISPSLMISSASELSAANTCPSLSPSPPPYPQSFKSNAGFDFCDPRHLTVGVSSSNSALQTDFPTLPTLCAGDDEAHRFLLGGEIGNKTTVEHRPFEFTTTSHHGLPIFVDEFSDLDSEDEFVNRLVNFPPPDNVQFLGSKRQRTSSEPITSDLLSFTHDNDHFISEDEFEDFEDTEPLAAACLPSPPASTSENEMKPERRNRKIKTTSSEDGSEFDPMARSRKITELMSVAAGPSVQENANESLQHTSTAPSQSGSSDNNVTNMMGSGSDGGAAPQQAPVNRRGRKQSLTEDPSKTFVCDLCHRRFRRQEHLKRHYRSLHTQEKPFECHECGKKFSRSDNLSQHARTHGSGAIVMGVLEDGELPTDHPDSASDGEIRGLARVLFEVTAAAPGSDSSEASSESDSQSRKKRRRSE